MARPRLGKQKLAVSVTPEVKRKIIALAHAAGTNTTTIAELLLLGGLEGFESKEDASTRTLRRVLSAKLADQPKT